MPTMAAWALRLAPLCLLASAAWLTFDLHRSEAEPGSWDLSITLSPPSIGLWVLGALVAWWARRRAKAAAGAGTGASRSER
jgi:hypothetical protein